MIKKIKKQMIVVQKNELIQNSFYKHLTLNDMKLLKLFISKINNNQTLFSDFYIINYKELDFINLHKSPQRYSLTLESLKRLSSTFISIENKKSIKTIGLIQNNFTFNKYETQFCISFHNDLKDFLLILKEKFTSYDLEHIRKITSKSTLKLYEYLKSFNNTLHLIELRLDTLKTILEVDLDDYKLYGNFKQKVLNKSINEINKYTDLGVRMEEVKENRKVIKIVLIFDLKDKISIK